MKESADRTNEASEDAFLSDLRLDQSYGDAAVGVRRVLATVPVRKPTKTDFFRVHPQHLLDCFCVELKAEGEIYFVTQTVAPLISEFCEPVRLRLCVTRQGVAFLWPIKLPTEARRGDAWRRSAAEAAHLAESKWTRLSADMNLGAYQPFEAVADLGEPKWPTEPWMEILKIAMRDRRIDTEDHAVIRQLLGRV